MPDDSDDDRYNGYGSIMNVIEVITIVIEDTKGKPPNDESYNFFGNRLEELLDELHTYLFFESCGWLRRSC